MYAYLNLLFNICSFKKRPQDIPHSQLVLRLTVLAYAVTGYLLIHVSTDTLSALLQAAVEIIRIIGFAGLMLSLANKLSRPSANHMRPTRYGCSYQYLCHAHYCNAQP